MGHARGAPGVVGGGSGGTSGRLFGMQTRRAGGVNFWGGRAGGVKFWGEGVVKFWGRTCGEVFGKRCGKSCGEFFVEFCLPSFSPVL